MVSPPYESGQGDRQRRAASILRITRWRRESRQDSYRRRRAQQRFHHPVSARTYFSGTFPLKSLLLVIRRPLCSLRVSFSAGDMQFRMKISVFDRPSDFDRPLALSFKNLAVRAEVILRTLLMAERRIPHTTTQYQAPLPALILVLTHRLLCYVLLFL